MKKILLFGQSQYRDVLLQTLQRLGVVHLEPLQKPKAEELAQLQEKHDILQNAIEVISLLAQEVSCSTCKKSVSDVTMLHDDVSMSHGVDLALQIQEIHARIKNLQVTANEQKNQLAVAEAWGNFSSQSLEKLRQSGVRVRLWKCPSKDVSLFQCDIIPWQRLHQGEMLVATVSYQKDVIAPTSAQEIVLTLGTKEILELLHRTQEEIAQQQKVLCNFVQYLDILQQAQRGWLNFIAFTKARSGICEHPKFFGVKGWVPITQQANLFQELQGMEVTVQIVDPLPEENPPTLIQNPKWIQSILDVVLIYATPGYGEWDTSASIYFAFAVFFAMIVGDGGYGLLLLALMLKFRKTLLSSDTGSRVYRMMVSISVTTIVWGAITGTWFAINLNALPHDGFFSYLRYLQTLQLPFFQNADTSKMMLLSIYVGVVHLSIAKVIQVVRFWPKSTILGDIGWLIGLWSVMGIVHWQNPYATYGLWGAFGLILLCSSTSRNIFRRIADGLLSLLGVTQLFADVLSYLRLFALGLAGTVLGSIFNDMGMKLQDAFPGVVGYCIMLVLLFFGHSINLLLAVMGGFIHGLRLNFLEFYRYCFEGTGYYYAPLKKLP